MEASHGAAGAPAVVVVKKREVSVEKVVLEDLTVKRDLVRERASVSGVTASRREEDTVDNEELGTTGTLGLKPYGACNRGEEAVRHEGSPGCVVLLACKPKRKRPMQLAVAFEECPALAFACCTVCMAVATTLRCDGTSAWASSTQPTRRGSTHAAGVCRIRATS